MKQKKCILSEDIKLNMIFVNSCNLSKSKPNACEEKGIKETNETKHKKRKSDMAME